MTKAVICFVTLLCAASVSTGADQNLGAPTEKNVPGAKSEKFEKRVGHQKFTDYKVLVIK